ncbi:disease resistance protein RRS1-like [Prosopis cineraria]|uniref:disease resistance protein RRS1-like n=1 Tax=Prosopis cineraria TaxID=364024 RepID=UPI00240ED0FC|nr:disease resistance protein RRS1-like [Prosopis cineraria]
MTLLHLPALISISNGLCMGPSLEKIGIYDCPKLHSLPKMLLSVQNLKVIKGATKWWEALAWNKEEWGIKGRPYMFDSIFSPIDEQADIMSQLDTDGDQTVKTWKKVSPSFEDGHSWRKYDQRVNINSLFPREYFRCTHKYRQGCQAIKQVQGIDEKPYLYSITYIGGHTCTQASNVTDSSMINQADLTNQFGDDIDDNPEFPNSWKSSIQSGGLVPPHGACCFQPYDVNRCPEVGPTGLVIIEP